MSEWEWNFREPPDDDVRFAGKRLLVICAAVAVTWAPIVLLVRALLP